MRNRFEVVEDDCIGCALCSERAPENVEMLAEETIARVVAQPANEREEQACLEAADYCPIGALSLVTPESSNEYPHTAAVAAAPSS